MQNISKLLIFIVLLLNSLSLHAQHSLSGTIRGYGFQQLYLAQVAGDRQILLDSTKTNVEGAFTMHFPDKTLPGMYVLKTQRGQSIKLIYNMNDIRFVSGGLGDEDVVEFIESPDNELWYQYFFHSNMTQYLQEMLKPLLVQYPDDTPFYIALQQEFERLQDELHNKAATIISENPYTLAARYIQYDLAPKIDLTKSFDEQREALKNSFFTRIDFNDDALLRSDILNRKFIDFISMHQHQGMGMAELQLSFIRAVDVILLESAVSPEAYIFAINYLVEGFSRMGLNAVVDFISSLPHLNPGCMEPEHIEQLEKSIAPFRKIAVGTKAPDISAEDIAGNPFRLSALSGKKTLLVFWSVGCPFCIELLPDLKAYQKKHPEIHIVSVIIGHDNKELRDLIQKEQLDWVHIVPRDAWKSKTVEDYHVYATPTMFLIDENRQILLKPFNYEELETFTSQ